MSSCMYMGEMLMVVMLMLVLISRQLLRLDSLRKLDPDRIILETSATLNAKPAILGPQLLT